MTNSSEIMIRFRHFWCNLSFSDPNQQYYGQQPGFNPGYPPQGGPGYPPQGGPGYPPQGFGAPGGYPPQPGFPQPGFQQPGFGGMPATVPFHLPPPQTNDSEDGGMKGFEFNDESIRKAFIRKVYSILMVSISDKSHNRTLWDYGEALQKPN